MFLSAGRRHCNNSSSDSAEEDPMHGRMNWSGRGRTGGLRRVCGRGEREGSDEEERGRLDQDESVVEGGGSERESGAGSDRDGGGNVTPS